MKPIVAPIQINETSDKVASLQAALAALGTPVPTAESKSQTAGPQTVQVVRTLQAQNNLRFNDVLLVDAITADLINRLLKGKNLLDAEEGYTVRGKVLNERGEALAGQNLQAFDIDLKGADTYQKADSLDQVRNSGGMQFLGEAVSGADGGYIISFTEAQYNSAEMGLADVIVYATDQNTITGRSDRATVKDYKGGRTLDSWDVIVQGDTIRSVAEFTRLLGRMREFLRISGMEISDLFRSPDRVTFAADELQENLDRVQILVSAAELAQSFPNDPAAHALLYGLGREKISLLLSSLALTAEQVFLDAWQRAAEANIIDVFDTAVLRQFLQSLHIVATARMLIDPPTDTVAALAKSLDLSIADKEVQAVFINASRSFDGTAEDFWNTYLPSLPEFKAQPQLIASLQLTNQLVALTGNHLPMVTALQQGRRIKRPQDLVALADTDWDTLVKEAGAPNGITGSTKEEKQQSYKEQLQATVDAVFPTQKIAAMVQTGQLPAPSQPVKDSLLTFFSRTPAFDIQSSRIVDFDQQIKDAGGDQAPLLKQHLARLQRLFAVSPTSASLTQLVQSNIQSAGQIANIPRQAFSHRFGATLGGEDIALAIHQRASFQTVRMEKLVGTIYDLTKGVTPKFVMDVSSGSGAKDIIAQQVANWTTLFGSPDVCECEECRSVYGAAAYMVDLLQFLAKLTPNFFNKTPLDLLLVRRPDIAYLPLTCENTNTLIPYIDVANEIMEYYVAHGMLDANAAYDTGDTTADELRANPQNTLKDAYSKIKDAAYPFSLPYHQPLDVERIYYGQLRTTRAEVMTTFQTDFSAQAAKAVNAETLMLAEEEYKTWTGKDFTGTAVAAGTRDYYGIYADDNDFLAKIYHIPELLRSTGISYPEIVDLLLTEFVNPGQPVLDYIETLFSTTTLKSADIYTKLQAIAGGADPSADADIMTALTAASIAPADFKAWTQTNFPIFQQVLTLYQGTSACDLATTQLRTLQAVYEGLPGSGIPIDGIFVRLHSFIRAWRKLKWNIFDLDAMVSALGATSITDTLVDQLAVVRTITGLLPSTPLNKLATLWGSMQWTGKSSLYEKLFLNRTTQKIDTAFQADAWGAYLSDTTALLKDHLPALQAAFRVSGEDLNPILSDSGLIITSAILNRENLSSIYRYTVLAKALGISIADLVTLKKLFGIDPFSRWDEPSKTFADIHPDQTLAFLKLVSAIKDAGFRIATLNYVLADVTAPLLRLEMAAGDVQTTAMNIRKGFLQIGNDHPDSDLTNNFTEDQLRAKLQLIYQPAVVDALTGMLNGTSIYSTLTDKNLPITIPAPLSSTITYIKGSGRLQSVGVLSNDAQTTLNGLIGATPNFVASVKDLFEQPEKFLQDNFSALFPANMADALKNLLDHPHQPTPLTEQQKISWFYQYFLPYLKNQLRRNVIVQTIATLIGLDEPATQIILQSTMDKLVASLAPMGLTGDYFVDETFTTAGLNRTDKTLDFSWNSAAPDPLIPADHFSIRWEGLLNPPASADYTLIVQVAAPDDAFKLFVDGQLVLQKNSGDPLLSWEVILTLSMSRAYPLKVEYVEQTGSAGIQLFWKTETSPKEVVPADTLYPQKMITDLTSWLRQFQKAALFATGFKLNAAELDHFIEFKANFSGIDLSALTGIHWQRIADYTRLRRSVPASSPGFIDLFELADRLSPAPALDEVLAQLQAVTGWNDTSLGWLVKTHFNFTVADFRNEIASLRLLTAMTIIQRTGVAADALAAWAVPETDFNTLFDQSQEIKKAVKAKYEDEDWLPVAGKLSDKLRENQKQALIAFLLVQPALLDWGVIDAESLYEYFLIDVQMCACMDTSRIVQDTAAIQLFLTRCTLNLESRPDSSGHEAGVDPAQIDQSSASRLEWMKFYRVWEAARKIFLYPENWMDPELRDDKSSFFTELESELLQNDITPDSVQTAFYNYLNKLDEVSHLDVCGMFQEDDEHGDMQTLHVFGRTHGKPHFLYYRTCNKYWHWSAWEKVSVDVKGVDGAANSNLNTPVASGVHLTPVYWKDRLFIFWPEFLKKQPDNASSNGQSCQDISNSPISDLKPSPYWEVSLGWSEYKNGKWTPKSISKEFFVPSVLVKMKDLSVYYVSMQTAYEPDLKNYFFHPSIGSNESLTLALIHQRTDNHGQFILSDIHNPAQVQFVIGPNPLALALGGGSAPSTYPDYTSYFMQLENSSLVNATAMKLKGEKYLQTAPDHKLIYSPQINDFENALSAPFFYRDDNRSYFIRSSAIISWWDWQIFKKPQTQRYIPFQVAQQAEATRFIPRRTGDPAPDVLRSAVISSRTGINAASAPRFTNAIVQVPDVQQQFRIQMAEVSSQSIQAKTDYQMGAAFSGKKKGSLVIIANLLLDKGLTFYTSYHPYSQSFIRALNTGDVEGLMQCDTTLPDDGGTLFENTYHPNHTGGLVSIPADLKQFTYYKQNVAFDEFSLYGMYNWELFYHTPLYIATRLSRNGKYEEAMRWFHFIFDPGSTEKSSDPKFPESKYWKVLPFKTTLPQSLLDYFESLQPGKEDPHIEEWKDNPFKPFLVARDRPIAFMKNVVMRYIDNLVAWGDDLFRTDTRENINTATQLYIMAAHILGPKPQVVPMRGKIKAETYHSLQPKLDDFSNAMVDLENLFPYTSEIKLTDTPYPGNMLGVGSTLYFCIPDNDRLLAYWDTVGDRLFKIRHCMNIEGVERSLALFAPPIDPGMLVRATASGLSIGSILADLNSPGPLYRFTYLVQKASEFCSEVKGLGSALLTAIEKKESEAFSRIRAAHESSVLNLMTLTKQRQILDAKAAKQNLEKSRETIVRKIQYHLDFLGVTGFTIPTGPEALSGDIDQDYALPDTVITEVPVTVDVSLSDSDTTGVKVIPKEKEHLAKDAEAVGHQLDALSSETMSGFFALIPEFNTHATPIGVGLALTFGGKALSWIASSDARQSSGDGAMATHAASRAATMASYIRRDQENTLQANQSLRELAQLDKQILGADIRIQIAQKEMDSHQQQITNAQEIEDYLQNQLPGQTKFTTEELYGWMKEQLYSVYKQGYQLAFDMARRAEKAYQFETGNWDTGFIQYGYFDSTYQGLTAGEQLSFAIRQLEKAFTEQNKREFELTKHISLATNRPDLLVSLKQTGSCTWAWPEEWFDLDYPGHYFRRIRTVSISIPCVSGPYTSVNATLRLMKSSIRIKTGRGDSGYAHNNDNGILTDDDRFTETKTPFTAIATSTAQNDSGVFELNFRDDRYLPFEGAGAVSQWKLELNGKYLQDDNSVLDISQFDFNSISDVIVHLHYTSREDAGQFRQDALANLRDYFANIFENTQLPLMRYFSARHDLPTAWYQFLHPLNTTDDQVFSIDMSIERFPFFVRNKTLKIVKVELVADSALPVINGLQLLSPDPSTDVLNLSPGGKYGALLTGSKNYAGSEKTPGAWFIKNPAANPRITETNITNLLIIIYYEAT